MDLEDDLKHGKNMQRLPCYNGSGHICRVSLIHRDLLGSPLSPASKGIRTAEQRARLGNQGISFPGSISASTGTRKGIGTSSQGRKGPSPSAKTHTSVRLKVVTAPVPSPYFCKRGNYQAVWKIKSFNFANGCLSKYRAIFTARFFSHQFPHPLKKKF